MGISRGGAKRNMRIIAIEDLAPGMILASPIYSNKGKLLLTKNAVLKETYMSKLEDLEIKYIYIYDELSKDIEIHDVIERKHMMRAFNALRQKNYDMCVVVASYIVGDLINNLGDLPNMKQLQLFDDYTFNHSFHVATLCTMVGIELGYNEERLQKLAMAGFMHDIGKEKIPIDIINKKGKLTDDEYRIIQTHPVLGYEMVKDRVSIPATVKHAILYHHENEDGSGYPEGKTGASLHEFAKIVHICDVYDAMVSRRSYKDELNPADVLEYLFANAGLMFDVHMVRAFKNAVFPYTTGSVVILSNGKSAIVSKNYKGFPDRPDVIVTDTKEVIELRSVRNVTIKRVSDTPMYA